MTSFGVTLPPCLSPCATLLPLPYALPGTAPRSLDLALVQAVETVSHFSCSAAGCGQPRAPLRCGDCRTAHYCSEACQLSDHPHHAGVCREARAFAEAFAAASAVLKTSPVPLGVSRAAAPVLERAGFSGKDLPAIEAGARAGDAAKAALAAEFHYNGLYGCSASLSIARAWLVFAADKGHVPSLAELGRLLCCGTLPSPPAAPAGVEMLLRAAAACMAAGPVLWEEMVAESIAGSQRRDASFRRGDVAESILVLALPQALRDNAAVFARIAFHLAVVYWRGAPGVPVDYAESAAWLCRADQARSSGAAGVMAAAQAARGKGGAGVAAAMRLQWPRDRWSGEEEDAPVRVA